MMRDVLWQPWDGPGLEHLQLRLMPIVADSLVIGIAEARPFRLHYTIRCDDSWRVREAHLRLTDDSRTASLFADGAGNWTDATGAPLESLRGCIDIDISATPFTNALPIRRLSLAPGAAAEIDLAYIAVPELVVSRDRQRYTCLATHNDGGLYRFESLASGFVADLPVDRDGLVLDYPGLFRRIVITP